MVGFRPKNVSSSAGCRKRSRATNFAERAEPATAFVRPWPGACACAAAVIAIAAGLLSAAAARPPRATQSDAKRMDWGAGGGFIAGPLPVYRAGLKRN